MCKFLVTVPPTREQGSYNSARAHDGLEPLSRMPAGTQYKRVAS